MRLSAIFVSCCVLFCTASSTGWTAASPVAYQWESLPINGGTYINGILIDAQRPNVVYVFSDIGGVFKSTDYGEHWRIMNRGIIEVSTHQSVAALAIHPRDRDILFAAVGCNFGRDKPQPPRGTGALLRSTDGGEHWQIWSDELRFCGHGITRQEGNVLAIDPNQPQVMYAGTAYEGVFRSANGGRTWAYMGLRNTFITTLLLRPDRPQTIYVAAAKAYVGKPFESKGGVFVSHDGGTTWRKSLDGFSVQCLVMNPQRPDVLYAACWDKGVYKTENGGTTWLPVCNGLIPGHGNRRYKALAIAPVNPDTLYCTSSEQDYRPPVTRFTNLYKTTDGGETWHKIPDSVWKNCTSAPGEYCFAGRVNWWGFFPSRNSIAVDPREPQRVYYTSGFGLWRSEDGGGTWRAKSRGLETATVQCLLLHPTRPGVVFAGYGERGLFRLDRRGAGTEYIGGGTTGWPSAVAATSRLGSEGFTLFVTGQGRIWRSEDEGHNWHNVLTTKGKTVRIAVHPTNPNILYAAVGGPHATLFVTEDDGRTWKRRASIPQQPTAIVANPRQPTVLYLRDLKRGVFRSDDGGRTWRAANGGLPSSDHGFSRGPLVIDPREPDTLYTGYQGGVFKTADGGRSWRNVFPSVFCKAIAMDPRTGRLYVSNAAHLWLGWWNKSAPRAGIYLSDDRGVSWRPLDVDGLLNLELGPIALDPFTPGVLYVGAGGNGLFVGQPHE